MKIKNHWFRRFCVLGLCIITLNVSSCQVDPGQNQDTTHDATQDSNAVDSDYSANTEKSDEEPSKPQRPAMQVEDYGLIHYRAGENLLYNGIALPEVWPPVDVDPKKREAVTPKYLLSAEEGGYRPEVIDITVGRQLFVDNFLIENTDLVSTYHQAEKYQENPVLFPATKAEFSGSWGVGTSAGGIYYDMQDCKYKMWYDVGFNPRLGYAESADGRNWTRIICNLEENNNIIMEKDGTCSVFIDYEADPAEKYKMLVQYLGKDAAGENLDTYQGAQISGNLDEHGYHHYLYTSSDGINWVPVCNPDGSPKASYGICGDMTTAIYNAFTQAWIGSLRGYTVTVYGGSSYNGRVRYYTETDTFEGLLNWTENDVVFWLKCDDDDELKTVYSKYTVKPQCYNFNAIAYESIMLGMFQLWRGPENNVIATTGNPKYTELIAAYSRDGFYYDRPDRNALIAPTQTDGDWDKGYLFCSVGGIIVHDDTIDIYYSAFSGYQGIWKGAHYNQAIGIATLRRDGFVSMDGKGTLQTRQLTVGAETGKKYLFVNADLPKGAVLRAEILDENGNVLNGFSMEECNGVTGDSTCNRITWKSGKTLEDLCGKTFSIRFSQTAGSFYSFWLSDSLNGESGGAVGAGYVQ